MTVKVSLSSSPPPPSSFTSTSAWARARHRGFFIVIDPARGHCELLMRDFSAVNCLRGREMEGCVLSLNN